VARRGTKARRPRIKMGRNKSAGRLFSFLLIIAGRGGWQLEVVSAGRRLSAPGGPSVSSPEPLGVSRQTLPVALPAGVKARHGWTFNGSTCVEIFKGRGRP
jgi:hypothetical protein